MSRKRRLILTLVAIGWFIVVFLLISDSSWLPRWATIAIPAGGAVVVYLAGKINFETMENKKNE